MFPTLKTTVSGMDPEKKYYILLDLQLADDCRYKFTGKEWSVAGKAEPQMPSRFFIHPDSPATGAQWMKHDISFQKVNKRFQKFFLPVSYTIFVLFRLN